MKFQKLTIHNIASIENAVIDFEAKPLADSDVFLITGKTGAGKSTILDAICLALYADTPRLYNTNMQGDIADTEKKTVKINDPRQLMRRNTGEASVALTFEGSNGVSYEAVWAVARSRKKVTGSIQSKSWELTNLETGKTLTKDAEIKDEMAAAIGLSFNQFCRTTMLAQGEFTRFLNSKDSEKAEILEKITGVDVYSKIGKKIYDITAEKKLAADDAKRHVEGTHSLSEEEIKERNNRLSEIAELVRTRQKDQDAVNSKLLWIKSEAEMTQKLSAASEAYQKAIEVVNSADFKEKEQLVKDWNTTIDARGWLAEISKAVSMQKSVNEELISLSRDFAVILGGKQYAVDQLKKSESEKAAVDAFIEAGKPKATVFANAQTIVGHLNTIADGRQSIATSKISVEEKIKKLNDELLPAQKKMNAEARAEQEKGRELQKGIDGLEKDLAEKNLEELRSKRDKAKELISNIGTAKDRIETFYKEKEKTQTRQTQLENLKRKIKDEQKSMDEMLPKIHDAELRMKVCLDVLNKQKDTVEKFAKTMRAKLHIGDVCPVCRQKIESEIPHEEELAVMVSGLQEAFDNAKKEYDDLLKVKSDIGAQIGTDTEAYKRESKNLLEDKTLVNAEQKALEACRNCGLSVIDEATINTLNEIESKTSKEKSELDAKIKSAEEVEKNVKTLRKDLDRQRQLADKIAEEARKADKAVDECKATIEKTQSLLESKKSDVSKAEKEVARLIGESTFGIDWNEQPKEFGEHLTADAKEYFEKLDTQKEFVSSIKVQTTDIKNVSDAVESISSAMPAWREVTPSVVCEVKNLLAKTNEISLKLTSAKTKLKSSEETIHNNEGLLKTFFEENRVINKERLSVLSGYNAAEINVINKALNVNNNNVTSRKAELDVAQKNHDEHAKKKPELSENDTTGTLNAIVDTITKQISELNEQKGAINQELKTDADNKQKLGTLVKEADEKNSEYQKWSRMNQLLGDAKGDRFRRIAQSYVLNSLIYVANSYMKTLTDRYTLKVAPGTFVISIEDAYQGYVTRAASTISGGESFLVSLSLALALSDIGQQLQVDTLFIDEGFGTLSGEPLQKAIETLRSLHTKAGRHVGIISHVEELQERIPVQIQVNQEGNNSSSKIKIIPE